MHLIIDRRSKVGTPSTNIFWLYSGGAGAAAPHI
jgi:hypothetical protein